MLSKVRRKILLVSSPEGLEGLERLERLEGLEELKEHKFKRIFAADFEY